MHFFSRMHFDARGYEPAKRDRGTKCDTFDAEIPIKKGPVARAFYFRNI